MKRRADGRWQKKKIIDGNIIYFYSVAETEKQATRDIENQMIEYFKNQNFNKHNFKAIADKMLEFQSLSISHNTLQCYKYSLQHLKPFYEEDIENITPAMVQRLIDDMSKKYNYSSSAISKTKITFGLVLDYAIVHEGLPLNNFNRSIKIPKSQKNVIKNYVDKRIKNAVIDNAEKLSFGMWAMILMCTGLRRGELAALQRKDIDFDENVIYITKSVEFISNQPHIKNTPKTEASIGTVPILNLLRPHLLKLCENLSPNEFLFGNDKPLTETQIKKRWAKYCKEIGITFNAHQLRHLYAKLIYKAGIDVKTAQRLLRHADFKTTMNIYTEFSNEMTDKSISKLNDYLKTV